MTVKFSSLPWHLLAFFTQLMHTPASYLVFAVFKEVKQSRRSFKANCPVSSGWSASINYIFLNTTHHVNVFMNKYYHIFWGQPFFQILL